MAAQRQWLSYKVVRRLTKELETGRTETGLTGAESRSKLTKNSNSRVEGEWNRDSIVIACCNLVAVLRLVPLTLDVEAGHLDNVEDEAKESHLLPPPAKEHYASVPSPWRAADAHTKTPEGSEESARWESFKC